MYRTMRKKYEASIDKLHNDVLRLSTFIDGQHTKAVIVTSSLTSIPPFVSSA